MPSLLAIISKSVFEFQHSGNLASPGDVMPIDCYRSKNRRLEGLAQDGDLFLVTVRPDDLLWLVAILQSPSLEENGWTAPANTAPITDISKLYGKLRLDSGKGIATRPGALGMSLQTPRTLAESDVALLRSAAQEQPQSSRVWHETYHAHTIEPATTGRSICQTCREGIAEKTLRLSEAFTHHYSSDVAARFHHLECAAKQHPYKLRQALATTSAPIPQREELEQTIAEALSSSADDLAARDDETAPAYKEFVELVLSRGPDSEAVLVFADWLQSVGDPRGELIIVQGQRAEADLENRARLERRECEILATNRKQFIPQFLEGKLSWERGFIRRLELTERSSLVRSVLASIFAHPSMLLLDELVVDLDPYADFLIAANLPALPRSVTKLGLHASSDSAALGNVSALVAPAPTLRSLSLAGVADIEELSHPTLESLEIVVKDASEPLEHAPNQPRMRLVDRLSQLNASALPALRRLVLRAESGADALCDALASSDLLPQLQHLSLPSGMTIRGAKHIAKRLAGGPKLATLDMSLNVSVRSGIFDCLREVCEQLIDGNETETTDLPEVEDWLVRHTRKPQWGVGRVVEEHDSHLEVEFEEAGLKLIRNPELLEDL